MKNIGIKFKKIALEERDILKLLKYLHKKQKYELKRKGFYFNLLYKKFYIKENEYFNYEQIINSCIFYLKASKCVIIKNNITNYTQMLESIKNELKYDKNFLSD